MRLDDAINVEDFRTLAKKRLPRLIFDVIDGGAGDETTLRANREAFARLTLRPRPLADLGERDISTTVLGTHISMPLMLDPCGAGQALHREAELAVARAAGKAQTVYALSTAASYELEDVAAVASGPLWFGLYLASTRQATLGLIDRAQAAGYAALCLTVDGAVNGLRERDTRNGFTDLRIRYTPAVIAQGLAHPSWSIDFLRGGVGQGFRGKREAKKPISLQENAERIRHTWGPVTIEDVRWIRERWEGPLVIKGILRADEVEQLLEFGVNGLVVSNHGGRQLDRTAATLDVLPAIRAAVGQQATVLIDGGIRHGQDIVAARALGADAVMLGRAYLYGLMAGGQDGVVRTYEILAEEYQRGMQLLGVRRSEDLSERHVGFDPPGAGAPA
jgi:isopentenyl diphosphate isomerase/L-lactate dehydrogenase-like FMN-dependent dehydrogenase